jgi:hypothetical protein
MNAVFKRLLLAALLIAIGFGSSRSATRAEEAGSDHYLPGATSSFIDLMPDRDTSTFAYLNAFTYYHGFASASDEFEIGGQIAANVEGTVYAHTLFFLSKTRI